MSFRSSSPWSGANPLRKKACVAVVLMGLFLPGCFSVGHQFPAGKVSAIRVGETTQSEIYNLFGTPWRTGLDNGMKTWTYGDYLYSLFEENSAEDLVIKFDKQGVVSSFSFNTTKRSR